MYINSFSKVLMKVVLLFFILLQISFASEEGNNNPSEWAAWKKEQERIKNLPSHQKIMINSWTGRVTIESGIKRHQLNPLRELEILKKYGNSFVNKKIWQMNFSFAEALKTDDLSQVFLTLMKYQRINPNQQLRAGEEKTPKEEEQIVKINVGKVSSLQLDYENFYTPLYACLLFDTPSVEELELFFQYGAKIHPGNAWKRKIAALPPEQYELMRTYGFKEPNNIADIALKQRNKALLSYLESRDLYPDLSKVPNFYKSFYRNWVRWRWLKI